MCVPRFPVRWISSGTTNSKIFFANFLLKRVLLGWYGVVNSAQKRIICEVQATEAKRNWILKVCYIKYRDVRTSLCSALKQDTALLLKIIQHLANVSLPNVLGLRHVHNMDF
jgi:hypothetical protein